MEVLRRGLVRRYLSRGVYDSGAGQFLSGSFMDYTLPRIDDLPYFDVTFQGIPCATEPLGIKGLGGAGVIGAFPAVSIPF
jgi:carbon-monoxide dehydrogenase large subunit